jgi:hypothetical protein
MLQVRRRTIRFQVLLCACTEGEIELPNGQPVDSYNGT